MKVSTLPASANRERQWAVEYFLYASRQAIVRSAIAEQGDSVLSSPQHDQTASSRPPVAGEGAGGELHIPSYR